MERYQEYFSGKRITLMGLGLLGRGGGDAHFLAECGADLIVTDLKDEEQLAASVEPLRKFSNVTFHLGGHRLEDFKDRDLIVKGAGVPLDSLFIAEAEKHHIPVRMSADLFAELAGVPIIGITGTRGKSTTTHMIAAILEGSGTNVLLGGNVRGVSTLSLLSHVTENTIAVLELDSWQLQGFGGARMSPQVAVFTTFYPDHLNYYKSDLETYFADKAQIFLYQSDSDTLVLGAQVEPFIKKYGYQNKIRAHVVLTGSDALSKNITLKIPGEHNRYNAALAQEAARALGVDDEEIKKALESFEGVPGRLQFVREVRGIKIYNDNNATTPDATVAALYALGDEKKKNLILIMGGSEKNLDMEPLLKEIPNVCKEVLLLGGAGTERIKTRLSDAKVYDAMAPAVAAAMALAVPGDVLLMSPAFASFGMFKNEYDRGDQFDSAVAQLS
jgi:UDP-N-acetylmuramoylalanine--D-glutamate ligase